MTLTGSELQIHSKDFRVQEGKWMRLRKWPTRIKPVYESKEQYQELLTAHVRELSALQHLHYASNRYAMLLIFQVMDAAGKDGASGTSYPGSISKEPDVQFQTTVSQGTGARFS